MLSRHTILRERWIRRQATSSDGAARPRRVQATVVVAVVVFLTMSTVSTARSGAQPAATCQSASVSVAAGLVKGKLAGTLCVPAGSTPSAVMVLVPGATYNQAYWDFPYMPQTYNFRLAMNRAGYATFTVDPLGTGASTHPLSVLLSSTVQATAVHQVVRALKAGRIAGRRFARVIIIGHSLGSMISIVEASTYHDVNGVVLTGMSHYLNLLSLTYLLTSAYPAALDPRFASAGYDIGYLTTRPGSRAALFYAAGTTDANVVAQDEATKDVVAPTEVVDGIPLAVTPGLDTLGIRVPVLIADGSKDQLFCGILANTCANAATLQADEKPYYSPAACLHTFVLPGSGHDLNLATNTAEYQQAVVNWADTYVPASGKPRNTCPT